jgi:hypothetical protein
MEILLSMNPVNGWLSSKIDLLSSLLELQDKGYLQQ